MKPEEMKPGDRCEINGRGDLYMDRKMRDVIGRVGTIRGVDLDRDYVLIELDAKNAVVVHPRNVTLIRE